MFRIASERDIPVPTHHRSKRSMISAGNRIVMTGLWPVAGRPGFLLALPMGLCIT
jgi:hypothetical protein